MLSRSVRVEGLSGDVVFCWINKAAPMEGIFVHIEVDSQIVDGEDYSLRVVRWISGIRDIIFPEFDENHLNGVIPFIPPFPPAGYWVIGPPSAIKGTLFLQTRPHVSLGQGVAYSSRSWEKFVQDSKREPLPFGMTLLLTTMISRDGGYELGTSVQVRVHRDEDSPDWVRFEANLPADVIDWNGSPALQRELVSFVRDWVLNFDTSYGHVTDDADSLGTALERAVKRYSWATIPHCREELRGYSWITIIPESLVGVLGGIDEVKNSGSFYSVIEGAGGSAYLQATELFSEYGHDEVRKVFRVLAPVLLEGMVGGGEDGDQPGRLIQGVDAADFRIPRDQ